MSRRVFYFLVMPTLLLAWFFVLGAEARAMEIIVDTVWTKAQSPMVVNDMIWLKPGVNLTIEKGVVIKFNSSGMLIISGKLTAVGAKAEPIVFTSIKDDLSGGDTNGDGAASAPAPGDWYYLSVNPGGQANLDYATVQYGGKYSQGGIKVYKGKLTVNNSLITKNDGGIDNTQGQLTINNSSIINNLMPFIGGVWVDAGVGNNARADIIVNATNNWWGTAEGPCPWRQLLPPGVLIWQIDIKAICGDKPLVDLGVVYSPWLTTSPDEPAVPEPVILVPGIMGSWNVSGRWQIDPIFHSYDNLMEALIAAGYKEPNILEPKGDLFTFPYDWRQDNNITADLLKEKIRQVKEISGRDKVDIIAHSMGGLVARSYIESGGYQNDVDQVIFLGTPHQGSPESYLKYEGAEFIEKWDWLKKYLFQVEAALNGYLDLTDYIRVKVPTVEQLLPIYDYLKDKQPDNSWLLRAYPLNYPQNNYLENLNSLAAVDLLKQRVKITNMVSDLGAVSTLNYLRVITDPDITDNKWQNGYPENLSQNLDSLEKGNGDSTVPFSSANSLNGVEVIKNNNSDHETLPTVLQKEIIKILTGKEPTDYFNNKITSTIKRWAFFRVYSPVDLAVIAPDGNRVGKDFASNAEINQIPDAFYSGFGGQAEFVLIPNPMDGEYKVELQGVDNGGEYTIANTLIDDNKEISKEFSGNIAPEQKREFNITYTAGAEEPLNELEPIDTVPPVVAITKPVAGDKYLRSDDLVINYTATDDFSGLAATTITIDGQAVATTTIDLFDYFLGQHNLVIQAIDKAGNQAQAQVSFEVIANIDSAISDIEEIHNRGWLKDRLYRPILVKAFRLLEIEAKYFDKEQKMTERLIWQTRDDRELTDKQKQRLIEQSNKRLAELKKNRAKAIEHSLDAIVRLLDLAKKQNQLNQPGYDIIISDISYLRENL